MSGLAWLDFSAEDQRRTREILRLFEETESRDELGIGQVRDAFSDLLFPGTSVLLTRARYFLIVPWCAQHAEKTAHRANPLTMDAVERSALVALKASAPDELGIIGARAGAAVKNLPSVIYANALETYGIARSPVEFVADDEEQGEHVTRQALGSWVSSLPPAPVGFPKTVEGGVRLTREEAAWLSEQIASSTPGSYFTHLLQSRLPVDDVDWPWTHPALATAAPQTRVLVHDAELFSLAMHGAALLYNLLIAEWYEKEELTRVPEPVQTYREALDVWEVEVASHSRRSSWDTSAMWQRVIEQNPRITANVRARRFISDWLDAFVHEELREVADSKALRLLVAERERAVKGAQSRLRNEKLLRNWAGASGSRRLAYRWGNVATLIRDIHVGLGETSAGA
ncbi:DUF6361 family protein [Blastococcus sp. CCUG 61487]|uniref:DUF6361 family protein n=1 Tax=Blastococcus sp. CCUG 61487 TaxID=1840703 RepID=UPI0010C09DF8|nr:DUF6361 family protein [Blastococcus sp. CCUG 61487]TKJ28319.1 hypothetical protein A6V29_02645 [Blastococcus sp. CCUG 61487]